MKTKAVVEGAILTAVTVILTILAIYLPMIGSFLFLLTPVPLIILTVRCGGKPAIIASLVTAIILAFLINPMMFLVVILNIGLIGISMGAAFEERFSSVTILLIGVIAGAFSMLLSLAISVYILEVDIVVQLEESLQLSLDLYREIGLPAEVILHSEQLFEQVLELIKTTYPAIFLSVGALIAGINYYFSYTIMSRLDIQLPAKFSVQEIKFPKIIVIFYVISIIFNHLAVWQNIYVIATFLLLLEGVAVAYYYFLQWNLNQGLAVFLIFTLVFFPLFNPILLLIGILDLWFDFRNLDKI
ncbi:DUF2232 domain-containing protein [Natroniella sp. ANB-PHB2]|uniref:DUF2232 domain-containing protein n=1 Tax=Natroniella sp. ANB-PHB2 TaxID=3384444 RepID=UPI0038D41565